MLQRTLAGQSLPIFVVKANFSMINFKIMQNKTKILFKIFPIFLIFAPMAAKFCLQVLDNYQQQYHLGVLCACCIARQRATKLNLYYPNTYSRIGNINSYIMGMPVGDRY